MDLSPASSQLERSPSAGVFFSHILTKSMVENFEHRPNLDAGLVRTYSKYFSQLRRVDDFVVLVDSLTSLLQFVQELRGRHLGQLEETKELFKRYYCYGERSEALMAALRKHLKDNNSWGEADNMSPLERFANFKGLGYPQYLPVGPMSEVILALRETRHCTASFGLMYLAPLYPKEQMDSHPAKFLGQIRQPLDFVHYVKSFERSGMLFNQGQVDYICEATAKFAYELVENVLGLDYFDFNFRQEQLIRNMRQRMQSLAQSAAPDAEALAVGQQILKMAGYANEVQRGFNEFALGWIMAVNNTFKKS